MAVPDVEGGVPDLFPALPLAFLRPSWRKKEAPEAVSRWSDQAGNNKAAGADMFEVLLFSGLGYTPSSGSWTRNLLPDGWKNGSGGNSQYWGPGTSGDPYDPSTASIPLARIQNKNAPGGKGGYMQTNNTYAVSYRRGPAGVRVSSLPCEAEGGIC